MGKSEVIDIDHGWADLFRRVKEMKETSVLVGILGDASKGGLHQKDGDGRSLPLTIQEIAAVNEFGTRDGHIPSRSFIRSTFDRMREPVQGMIDKLIVKVLAGELTTDKALSLVGLKLATEMKKTITDGGGVPPPNAESTIRAKGSSRPLVDTGRLVGSISYALVRDGEQGPSKKP